jgi:hypothetical protein
MRQPQQVPPAYGIEEHGHRFAAWAAASAASVKGCRFTVEQGRNWLEAAGFVTAFSDPICLPNPVELDAHHRSWREAVIRAASSSGVILTHGVASKLINVYLKARFVCTGLANHPKVAALHPPIDKLLLVELGRDDFAGDGRFWRTASRVGWSTFNSEEYEAIIDRIRGGIAGTPMWMIEQYWAGHQ